MYSGSSEAGVSTSMTLGDVARGDADCGEGCFGVGRSGGCGDAEGDCGRGGGSPGSASSSTVTFRGRVDAAAPFIVRQSPLVVDEADFDDDAFQATFRVKIAKSQQSHVDSHRSTACLLSGQDV